MATTAATPKTAAVSTDAAKKRTATGEVGTGHEGARGAPGRIARLVNPLILRLAGTRLVPLYGVITHQGRRSGKTFRTPVVVRSTEDGFVVPMPWGTGTDWYRNVRAAGGCTIRWKGRDYAMAQPEVIADPEATRAYFGGFARAMMRRFGITSCLRLRFSD